MITDLLGGLEVSEVLRQKLAYRRLSTPMQSGRARKERVNEEKERGKEGEMEIGNAHISSPSLDDTTIDQKAKRRVRVSESTKHAEVSVCLSLCPLHCAHSHKAAQVLENSVYMLVVISSTDYFNNMDLT